MDKDTLKGKGKDIAGRVERQVGEWTGREDLQAEGAGRQVEGKMQKGIGKVKEAGHEVMDKVEREKRDMMDKLEREKRRHDIEKKKDKVA